MFQEPLAVGTQLSCVLSINRSLWSSCVKRVTSWPAASVICPPTKTTGMCRGHKPSWHQCQRLQCTCTHSLIRFHKHGHQDADRTGGIIRCRPSSMPCVNFTSQRCFFLVFSLVHVGKALQDQRWLLQNLMARVEEKRSAVESTAKQIQGRWVTASTSVVMLMLALMLVKGHPHCFFVNTHVGEV